MRISAILCGTPIWVWCLLMYLLFVGYKATKTRIIFVPILFLVPTALLLLTTRSLWVQGIMGLCYFLPAFLVGLVLTYCFLAPGFEPVDRQRLLIKLKGSFVTLGLVLIIFSTKYFFGFLKAVNPDRAFALRGIEFLATGLFSGVMWGRVVSIIVRFLRVPYSRK